MVSRENRVLLASLAVVGILAVLVGASDFGDSAVVGLAVFAGVGVLAPQLYLAATDDDVAPRRRVRTGVGVTLFFVVTTYGNAPASERVAVGAVGGASLAALFVYEAVEGYRDAMASP